MTFQMVIYEAEFQPKKEQFMEKIKDIIVFIEKNGFKFERQNRLGLKDIKDEDFYEKFTHGEKYIQGLASYIFKKDEDISLELNPFNISLSVRNKDILDIKDEFEVLNRITAFIHKAYCSMCPFENVDENDHWNSYGINLYRMKIRVFRSEVIESIKTVKALAKKEGLAHKYVVYEEGLNIKHKIDTMFKDYGLMIKKELTGGTNGEDTCFMFRKEWVLYEEDDSIGWRSTFTRNLLHKMTQKMMLVNLD